MYKIIGADQKEYGPVTAEQLREWIAEGRVNGQTQVQDVAGGDWKPLSSVPELATALRPAGMPPLAAPLPGQPSGSQEAARSAVKGPAIGLMVASILDIVFLILSPFLRQAVLQFYSSMPQFQEPEMQKMLHMGSGSLGVMQIIFHLAVTALVLVGAFRMLALKNYTLVFVCAVLAVIPCITPCCGIVTLPFGIWALVVLNRPEVKAQFS